MIPFSPPRIDDETIAAVSKVLRSGWITTGPKTKEFERQLATYLQARKVACLSSWTAGAELVLRWYGVGPGDEVIVPAYTYAASANVICHVGATPVLVDSLAGEFNLDLEKAMELVTPKTKVIMPVDIGGVPALPGQIGDKLPALGEFKNEVQEKIGRPLIFCDAAHSVGSKLNGKMAGHTSDVAGYSFHAVKNLTTAEGGALAFYNPMLDEEETYRWFMNMSLHGQTKDALSKTNSGSWRYDIVDHGYKCNMTDIQAAIGLVELGRYEDDMLPRRKAICEAYREGLKAYDWAELRQGDPAIDSSNHLFMLRIKDATEDQRDTIIQAINELGVSVNVHFPPLPMLTAFSKMGYKTEDFPNAYDAYSREISLPVYYNLSDDQVQQVVEAVIKAVQKVLG